MPFADWRWNGLLLLFLIFVGLCALFIGWAFSAAQRSLDRQFERDMNTNEAEIREAMRRLPP